MNCTHEKAIILRCVMYKLVIVVDNSWINNEIFKLRKLALRTIYMCTNIYYMMHGKWGGRQHDCIWYGFSAFTKITAKCNFCLCMENLWLSFSKNLLHFNTFWNCLFIVCFMLISVSRISFLLQWINFGRKRNLHVNFWCVNVWGIWIWDVQVV